MLTTFANTSELLYEMPRSDWMKAAVEFQCAVLFSTILQNVHFDFQYGKCNVSRENNKYFLLWNKSVFSTCKSGCFANTLSVVLLGLQWFSFRALTWQTICNKFLFPTFIKTDGWRCCRVTLLAVVSIGWGTTPDPGTHLPFPVLVEHPC